MPMTSSSTLFFFTLIILNYGFLVSISAAAVVSSKTCAFRSIYQFGDSINDVGNLIRMGSAGSKSRCGHLPYGQDLFTNPSGRCSNGLLMIDHFTFANKLPQLRPYLEQSSNVDHGVNFAVAGSTALNSSFFTQRNLSVHVPNAPLSTQLTWFKDHLNHVCRNQTACAERLQHSLVFMGEIGGNDFNTGFFQQRSVKEIRTYVPYVVQAITDAVREVIRAGARHLVVPGNFAIGCFPIYLNQYGTNDPQAYDDMGCLKRMNGFAIYQNDHLKGALEQLRKEYPDAVILYGDYYNAFLSVLRQASALGFDRSSALQACCGIGGKYNFTLNKYCRSGVPVCRYPARSISWDGVHLTQHTYMHMAQWLLGDLLPKMQCS
ncbi:acetylajmaline esterase [Ranunculus cassubicifolius]